MLAAAPHRGTSRRVASLGRVVMGVCNDPEWVTATMARNEARLAVFCGALDNEDELRDELTRAGGAEPVDGTSAATLLTAFERWEEDAVRRFRGSFAGAVTDGREICCFRDQFGSRPLFLHDGREGFFAATEVKQVLAGSQIRRKPDMKYLEGIVFGGIERNTAFRGVERVPKRSLAFATPEPGVELRQYWDPAAVVETAHLDSEQAVEGAREALGQAVERVLTGGDVILLSGGLDSPALAAFATRRGNPDRPAKALTAAYPDHPSVDERDWTQTAADHVGMRLHEFVPDARTLDDVERWVRLLDGPIDTLSIPELEEAYRRARTLGARTVVSGEIAEILFENRSYLLDHYLAHGRWRPLLRYVRELRAKGWSWRRLGSEVVQAVAPPPLVEAYLRRRPRRAHGVPDWLEHERLWAADEEVPPWRLPARRRWPSMQVSVLEGAGTHLEASEICAAVCGVDCRRPFADVDLWEFVLSLPAEVKFPSRRTKPLLRAAMRGVLPDAIIDRQSETVFNEYALARADYRKLRRLLVETPPYLDGVDYSRIRERLEGEDMGVLELQWARDLARVHAFLEQF